MARTLIGVTDPAAPQKFDEIATEVSAATSGLAALTGALATETSARKAADTAEATARTQADAAEISARTAGDAARPTFAEIAGYLRASTALARMFTSTVGGVPGSQAPISPTWVGNSLSGPAILLTGPQIVLPIAPVRVESLRPVRFRWLFRRQTDSDNPVNDTITVGIAWLNASFQEIGRHTLDPVLGLTAADGLQTAMVRVDSTASTSTGAVWPAGTVFAQPFLRTFGSPTAVTAMVDVRWTDLTDASDYSPALGDFQNAYAALRERLDGFGDLIAAFGEILAQSRSAGYLQNGTLDDARLSPNVMLADEDRRVTGEKTFVGRIALDADGAGGAMTVEKIGAKTVITPTKADGTQETSQQIVFDPEAENKWVVSDDLKIGGAAEFGDAATTRTNLDVYNKAYVDGILEAANAFQPKGGIDCSGNPNYPAANAGHVYIVTVAGKVGGGAGIDVEAGDMLVCKTDNSAAGTQAAVGANWNIVQYNVVAPLKFADIGVTVQAHDADLAAIAALTTTGFGRGLLTLADQAALLAAAGAQAADSDLTAIASLATTAFGRGLLTLADQAALLAAAGAQAADSDLTAIAALTPANGDVLQRVGGVWVNRTLAQLAADLGSRRRLLSNAQQASHTGNTTLTVLRSVVLPGGALGPNGVLSYNILWAMGLTVQNAAATVTGIRLGGVVIASPSLANTNRSHVRQGMLRNRNSLSSQVAAAAASANDPGSTSLVPSTFSIDTSVDQTLEIYVTLGNAADNAAVEAVTIEYSYGA